MKNDFDRIFKLIVGGGCVGENGGGYFMSAEDMQAEQKTWIEEDEARDIDFSVCPVWYLAGGGAAPYKICDAKDLEDFCKENDIRYLKVEKV